MTIEWFIIGVIAAMLIIYFILDDIDNQKPRY